MMGAAMLKRHQFVRSLWALYRLVVSSITWRSQAQPLLNTYKNASAHLSRDHLISFITTNCHLMDSLYNILTKSCRCKVIQQHFCA